MPKPTSEVKIIKFKEGSTPRKKTAKKHEDDLQEDNHVKTWSNLCNMLSSKFVLSNPRPKWKTQDFIIAFLLLCCLDLNLDLP